MNRKNKLCTLNLSQELPHPVETAPIECPTRKRLAGAFALLETLDAQRVDGEDPAFDNALEQRIIWREVLELELQAADEQIERIASAAADEQI